MRIKEEEGQAVVLVVLAISIFLIGAVGLGIDGSHLYSQRQMAQTAADAAAQAGMMSIFDGTNTSGTAAFSTSASFTCATTDARTPCKYASLNGFGGTAVDTVGVSFPADSAAPGVSFSGDPVNLIQVTVQRTVSTTLIRFLGTTSTTVKATAMAAIVTVESPTPLLITDPAAANSLTGNGNPTITICGGPTRSVQVNSKSATAYTGGVTLDLSHAGPADPGNCTTGTGAGFGVFGGDATDAATGNAVLLGTTGTYLSPSSPIQDPLAGVSPPSNPGGATPATKAIANGVDGCTNAGGCVEYSPGLYASLVPGKNTVIFKPGVYYVNGGGVTFKQTIGGGVNNSAMCVGCAADANTGTGMLIYDTGPTDAKGFAASGGFDFDTNTDIWFTGPTLTTSNAKGQTVPSAPYYNIVLWEDRNAEANSHTLGQGNGCFSVTGTVYITNTLAIMTATPAHVQSVSYGGNPCSNTLTQGDIIVSDLSLSGNKATIVMNLVPYGFLYISQVALVQ